MIVKQLCPATSVLVVCACLLSSEAEGVTGALTSSLSVSPTSLTFTARQGGPTPPAQSIHFTSTGAPVSWSAAVGSTWFSLVPPSGTTPSVSRVSVNTADLPAGSYVGTIIITASGATNSQLMIPVTLTITAANALQASPPSLAFSAGQGDPNPAAQSITLSSTGTPLNWSASADAAWLRVTPAIGTTPAVLYAAVNLEGLAAESYSGTLTITAEGVGNELIAIPVTLAITAPAGKFIQASPAPLAFSANVGDAGPPVQTLTVASTGGSMAWSAVAGASWLAAEPANGTTPSACSISVNAAGLSPGLYNSTITITAAGAGNSPVIVPVSLTVTAIISIQATPTSLAFTARQGDPNPAAQALTIASTGGPIIWGAAVDSSWLSLATTYGTTPSTLGVSVSVAGLSVGTYAGRITIAAPGASNTPIRVVVTLTVTAASADTIEASPGSFSFTLSLPEIIQPVLLGSGDFKVSAWLARGASEATSKNSADLEENRLRFCIPLTRGIMSQVQLLYPMRGDFKGRSPISVNIRFDLA